MKISHQDIKELMPDLKRVSFESLLKDKTCIYNGDIIPVKDTFNNIVPYKNPMIEYEILSEFNCEPEKEQDVIEYEVISEDLNMYELYQLCRYFKTHNKMLEYRATYKILKERKEEKQNKYNKKIKNYKGEKRK